MYNSKNMILTAVFVILSLKIILSLQIIPERAMVTYTNEKYLYANATVFVRRYGRKSGYYLNGQGTLKKQLGNNVSMTLIFYEFLHNEYKRSFVEMKFDKICDSLNTDPYLGAAFRQIGLVCPLPVGHNNIMNVTIPVDNFPHVWPFERCKVEGALVQNQNKDIIATADVYLFFKQMPRG